MEDQTNTVVEQASPVETPVETKVKTDSYICPVSKVQKKTNNVQMNKFAQEFGLTLAEATTSMVSQEGRRALKEEKLTAEQVVEKYGIHLNVAQALRCVVKPAQPRKAREKKVEEQIVTPKVETPVDTSSEVVFVEQSENE
jgi:hypothetical protein